MRKPESVFDVIVLFYAVSSEAIGSFVLFMGAMLLSFIGFEGLNNIKINRHEHIDYAIGKLLDTSCNASLSVTELRNVEIQAGREFDDRYTMMHVTMNSSMKFVGSICAAAIVVDYIGRRNRDRYKMANLVKDSENNKRQKTIKDQARPGWM